LLTLAHRFFSESLFKNSAFLLINLAVGAVCGYASLTLITHVFSVRDVGLSATAVAAISLVTSITQFGVTWTIPRYLPITKDRIALINTLLTAVILATTFGSIIFLVLPYAKSLWALGGVTFDIVFVIAACVSAGQTVLSAVLVADRASDKLAILGLIPNVTRVVAPPVFSFLGGLGAFMARIIADLFSVIPCGVLLARRGHRFRVSLDREVVHDVAKFAVGMYFATLIGGLPQLVLPLIVLSRVGAQQTAYWSIAISIGALLFSLPSIITQALLPEVSLRPTERRVLLARSVKLSTALIVPVLLIAFFCAPIGLAMFGRTYVSGALVPLRWLIIAGFITMLNYASGAILFIAKKSGIITIVNVIDAVVVLGLVAFWATDVADIAIAWMIGDICNTVFFGLFAFIALREVGGRWEELGGDSQVEAAVTAAHDPLAVTATSQFRAIEALATLAQLQRTAQMYRPQHKRLTESQGLFSIAAMRAAERQMEQFLRDTAISVDGMAGTALGIVGDDPDPDSLVESHKEALNVLFELAERQQVRRQTDPEKYWAENDAEPTE
jgi:O-antigen/teichoic acid export membrane protein